MGLSEYQQKLNRIKLGLEEKTTGKKPPKPIPKKSAKKIKEEAEQAKEKDADGDTQLQKWFKNRQKQLTGKCMRCGKEYDHKNLRYAIAATAHVLAKRDNQFPSVALHKDNFIELGASCGCHYWYDNFASWEEIALSNIWPLVLERFRLFEPFITERARIPEVLQQEIKPKI